MSHDVSGRPGDKLVNLCRDSGDTLPNFDASKMRIYKDRLGESLIDNSSIPVSFPDRSYSYYHKGGGSAWEVCVGRDGDIICVLAGFASPIRKVLPTKPFPVRSMLHFSDFGTAGDDQTDDFLPITDAINAISELPINTLVAWPDDVYLVKGYFELEDGEWVEKFKSIIISASDVTLDFNGAFMTGRHRIIFDGDSGINGDRSAILSNVHIKNLTTRYFSGNTCPKAPWMKWCEESSMVNVTSRWTQRSYQDKYVPKHQDKKLLCHITWEKWKNWFFGSYVQ